MQELLIFRINDSKDLDVYYKDRDMKEFVKITNVKYKSGLIKRINGDKSENLLLNNNIIEHIVYNELPKFKDIRPELAGFILFLYNNQDDARAVTINDFMKKYLEYEDIDVWDSHIIEFDKDLFKVKIYFEFILNKSETAVNICYGNNKISSVRLITCTLDNLIKETYAIDKLALNKFIDELKLNFDADKVIKVLKRTVLYVKDMAKSDLLNSITTSIVKNETINFYDIKLD